MIADMETKSSPIVTVLFLRGRKPNISHVYMSQTYFKIPKIIRLNATIVLSWKYLTNKNFNK